MGIQENKDTVIKFLRSMETETDFSLACDDMRWWLPDIGYIDRKQFQSLMDKVMTILKTPVAVTITNITAEDDRVAVEFNGHAELFDGRCYDNTYHFLYILRDGRIAEQREHANSAYAMEIFGPHLTDAAKADPSVEN